MNFGLRLAAGLSLAALGCGSPTSPTGDETPGFAPVGDIEMVRCQEGSCDQFAFMLRNVGRVCVLTLGFQGTVTLTKADGTTSTANWKLENPADRWFLLGETRRMVQNGGELKNPPGPHTYSIAVTWYAPMRECLSRQ